MVTIPGGVVGECAAQFEPAGKAAKRLNLNAAGGVVLDGDRVMPGRPAFGVERNVGVVVTPFAEQGATQQRVPVGDRPVAFHRIGGVVALDAGGDGRLDCFAGPCRRARKAEYGAGG